MDNPLYALFGDNLDYLHTEPAWGDYENIKEDAPDLFSDVKLYFSIILDSPIIRQAMVANGKTVLVPGVANTEDILYEAEQLGLIKYDKLPNKKIYAVRKNV